MRTTLDIDDYVLRRAKELAAQRGTTLTALIEEGLREVLVAAETRAPYRLDLDPVDGEILIDVAERRAMYDAFDEDSASGATADDQS
ncbi:MAG TPA: type II toxin-antitoxin system VapB family antitoxin [Nitriliruptorales bacterium]